MLWEHTCWRDLVWLSITDIIGVGVTHLRPTSKQPAARPDGPGRRHYNEVIISGDSLFFLSVHGARQPFWIKTAPKRHLRPAMILSSKGTHFIFIWVVGVPALRVFWVFVGDIEWFTRDIEETILVYWNSQTCFIFLFYFSVIDWNVPEISGLGGALLLFVYFSMI